MEIGPYSQRMDDCIIKFLNLITKFISNLYEGRMMKMDSLLKNKKLNFLFLGLASIVTLTFSACAPVGIATGVGAAVGIASAKEGGLNAAVTDEQIRMTIKDLWFKKDLDIFAKLNLTVNQGRVLITGVIQKPEDRVEAVRLAWQAKGVKQVINEIRVGPMGGVDSYAKDSWITGQLRTRLTFEKYVQSINYTIETVRGTVYLMGVAQNQRELDRVINIARKIQGVKEVISYVKLLGEPVRNDAGTAMSRTQNPSAPTRMIQPSSDSYNDGGMGEFNTAPNSSSNAPYGSTPSGNNPGSVQSEVLPP